MRSVRGEDTTPELAVRRLVHRLGFRFKLHVRSLPGKPDLVFPGRSKIIMVHGCFWHGHCCRGGRNRVVGRYRKFRLDRPTGNGGNTNGVFTLLFRNAPQGWKILLDPQELGAIVAPMATE